jgi:hypothetical protein
VISCFQYLLFKCNLYRYITVDFKVLDPRKEDLMFASGRGSPRYTTEPTTA